MTAISGAFAETLPREFFAALAETEEEADAMHALHVNRAEWEKSQRESPLPEIDGGL